MERIDKVICAQTKYSRKDIKDLVRNKRVSVNDIIITKSDIKIDMEVDKILGSMGMSRVDVSKDLKEGSKVKIISGPFKDMTAKIDTVDMKEQKLNVLVDLFGQETIVEVLFTEIEKA